MDGIRLLHSASSIEPSTMSSDLQEHGRSVLWRLVTHLGLSYQELGDAFSVPGETVRRWELGSHPIPEERLTDLIRTGSSLERILAILQPERLPGSLRRKTDLFGGEAALDWILRGRIEEVADCYEAALVYQG